MVVESWILLFNFFGDELSNLSMIFHQFFDLIKFSISIFHFLFRIFIVVINGGMNHYNLLLKLGNHIISCSSHIEYLILKNRVA